MYLRDAPYINTVAEAVVNTSGKNTIFSYAFVLLIPPQEWIQVEKKIFIFNQCTDIYNSVPDRPQSYFLYAPRRVAIPPDVTGQKSDSDNPTVLLQNFP